MLTSILLFLATLFMLVFFLSLHSTLSAIVLLEIFSFLSLLSLATTPMFSQKTALVLVSFCLFILESVFSLIFLINLVSFSGSDYQNTASLYCI